MTSGVVRRAWQHREGSGSSFAAEHGARRLVHVEEHDDMAAAISREKAIKKWRRAWKIELIEKGNPDWRDLWFDLNG